GILTGSAREAQQIRERTGVALRDYEVDAKDREIGRRRKVLEAKVLSLQSEFESAEEELNKIYLQEELKKNVSEKARQEMLRLRRGETEQNIEPKKKSK
ncbi:MAG: circadian clock protein KaiC, partial [Mucilaginibacter sp.]